MDTVPRPDDGNPVTPSETEAERQRRAAWEPEMTAEADADIAAGRLIDEAAIGLATIRANIRWLKQHPCRYPVGQHPGVRELPCAGGYQALYRVIPDTGSDETAGDVLVLRVFGPGRSRNRR